MKWKTIYISILFVLAAIILHLYPRGLSFYLKPAKIYRGSAALLVFENLNKNSKYELIVNTREKTVYPLQSVQGQTIKLIAIPLDAPDKIKLTLLENNQEYFSDEISVYKKHRGLLHITVEKQYVTPDKQLQERIYHEYLLINKAKRTVLNERYFFNEPYFPIKNGKTGTPFGYDRIFNQTRHSIHKGQDISAPQGTEVHSLFKGRVILTGDFHYTGKTVFLHHGDNLVSLYAHLDKIMVAKDQIIAKGHVIGLVGSTGRSTGPHLHLGTFIQSIPVDPMSLFEIMKD